MKTTNNKQVFNHLTVWLCRQALVGVFLLSFTLFQGILVNGQNELGLAQTDSAHMAANIEFSKLIEDAEFAWKINDSKTAELQAKSGYVMLGKYPIHDSNYAKLLHTYGKLLIDRQANNSGIDSLFKSIRLKIQLYGENHISLSKTYNYIGIGYFQMRDYTNANKFYKFSVNIQINNKIWGPNLFDSFLNLGIVEAVQGKYDRAYIYFDTTQMVLDSARSQIDSLFIARFYSNYGLLATLNGRLEEGNEFFNRSELIYQKILGDYSTSIANININKGVNAFFNYDFNRSKLYYNKALQVYNYNDESTRATGAYMNLGSVSIKSGNYNEAIQFLNIGLRNAPNDELKWLFYSNLTQAYIALNDDQNALFYFNKALDLQEEGRINSIKKINLFIEFANFKLAEGQLPESKKYYDEALRLVTNSFGKKSAAYANVLTRLGYYYLKTDAVDSALYYFNDAIELWSSTSEKSDMNLVTINEVKLAESYIGRSKAFFQKYTESNNIDFLEVGSKDIKMILERMEQVISKLDKESKFLLFDQLKPAYSLAIDIAFEQNRISNNNAHLQDLFNYMERSKSAVLLASVRNLDALKSTDVPASVMQIENQLNEEINGIRQLLTDERQKTIPVMDKISFFESKLLRLLNEHDSLVASLEENYPKYYALKYDRSTIQLTGLLAKLEKDEAIVEYELADTSIYIYAITKNGIHIQKARIDSSFWRSLDYMLIVKNVNIAEFRKSEIDLFYEHSNNLWRTLIEPVCHFIKSKRLVIIPDGVLGYLPFELLIRTTENSEEMDFKNMPYLIKEFPVSYSYSATLKYNPYFTRKGENNKELIAFAPHYEQVNKHGLQTRDIELDNLPNARQEVIGIEDMWGGKIFMDEDATKANFIKSAGKYDIIHLAMHAMINDSVPMFSKLIFSESEKDTGSVYLNTFEIYDLVLNASMVTLSACNTGTGILRNGEGIMSLARGFIYAGVPSIIMTLWEIQDKSGFDIMTKYYSNLLLGDSKDVALQKAKLEFLQASPDYSTHPFYWSAFIVTGDTQPLINNKLPLVYSILISGGLLCLLVILWFLIRHKKRSGKTV